MGDHGADDRPVGFVITAMVDGCVHVEQAAAAGIVAMTLTTFADVPWYARTSMLSAQA